MQPSSRVTVRPFRTVDRVRLFGRFDFKAKPLPDNPEHIIVAGTWAKENLVTISLGALAPAQGADHAVFHRLVAPRVQKLIEAWDAAGFAQDVLTWNGSYVPRFIRGSTTMLSAHAFGSAFDINRKWNPLGKEGAALGEQGSVLRLVPIAEKLGFYWGGNFPRRDLMHFELCRLR